MAGALHECAACTMIAGGSRFVKAYAGVRGALVTVGVQGGGRGQRGADNAADAIQ